MKKILLLVIATMGLAPHAAHTRPEQLISALFTSCGGLLGMYRGYTQRKSNWSYEQAVVCAAAIGAGLLAYTTVGNNIIDNTNDFSCKRIGLHGVGTSVLVLSNTLAMSGFYYLFAYGAGKGIDTARNGYTQWQGKKLIDLDNSIV